MMVQKSAVWNHMEKVNTTTAKCKLCRKEPSITGGQTSRLKHHLEMQHTIDAKVKASDDRQPKNGVIHKRITSCQLNHANDWCC